MINIGLLDDESMALNITKASFQAFFDNLSLQVCIRTFRDPKIFLDSFVDTDYDLICLDIIMSPMEGTEVAKEVRKIDSMVPLIFISSNENKVFSCFDYSPIGFIRKTNFFLDTKTIMNHFIEDVYPNHKKTKKIEIRSHGETVLLNVDELAYIESQHNYQVLHMIDKTSIDTRCILTDLEEQLAPYGFLRAHKGFLVNYLYIYRFTSNELILKNQVSIPVSRKNRDEIVRKYMELTKESLV